MRRLVDRLTLRLKSLVRGGRADRSLKAELQLHLDEAIAENVAAGMSAEDARREAIKAFGPVDAIEEQCRDERRVARVEHLLRDLRYSFRSLARQPMLLATSLVSIAVAIGANTTIFSLATSLMFSQPTARDPGQLVHMRMGNGSHVSHRQWLDLAESGALAGITGFNIETSVNWRHGDVTTSLVPLIVSANFFDVIGVPMALGRGFTAVEADARRDPALAVVSHGFWESRLGSDASIVGRTLVFNGRPYTVLGVLPDDLRSILGFGLAPEVYLPLARSLAPDLDALDAGSVQLVGRLRAGQSVQEGRAALETVGTRLGREYGREGFGRVEQFALAGSAGQLGSLTTVGLFFAVLLVVVGLILAIACANVAGLLLARATVRTREISVRIALGASRGRVVQQLLTEGFWIALAGATLGLLLMQLLTRLLGQISLPLPLPLELGTRIDARLLAYTIALTAVTTMLCALAPALQATRRVQWTSLRQDDGRGTRRLTLRNLLVVCQLAVALVLLVTASLFVRNLSLASRLDPGFDTRHTLVGLVAFVEGRYGDDTRTAWLAGAVDRAHAIPGVVAASYAHGAPLTIRNGMSTGAALTLESTGEKFEASYAANFVGPGYFETLGIPLISGREFRSSDLPGNPVVAIVNVEFARHYLGGMDPIGQRIRLPGPDAAGYPAEIVGVVGDSKFRSLGEEPRAAVYEAYAQRSKGQRVAHVFVRTAAEADVTSQAVARALGERDPSTAVEVAAMRDALSFAFLPSRIGAALLGALGVLGVLLAMGGLFAVVAYSVSRRTGEIGIRMALGADAPRVMRLVFRDAAILTMTGVTIGLAASWFVTKPLAMFLMTGVSDDPLAFVAAAVALVLVCFAAAWIPARRAVRIDPVTALRCE
jgi:putative ABC transport system permease protein